MWLLICYVILALIFPREAKEFFLWLFGGINERKKRTDYLFQIYEDEIVEAYKKDPDIFKKAFAGTESIKNVPADIFKPR